MSQVSAVLGAVLETPPELDRLQRLLDSSGAEAGEHLRSIITAKRRLDAPGLCAGLTGMRLLTVATVTGDGSPLTGPVDGYFLHGAFWFSTSSQSVRARHLSTRPVISVNHLPGDHFAVSAHGSARLGYAETPARGCALHQHRWTEWRNPGDSTRPAPRTDRSPRSRPSPTHRMAPLLGSLDQRAACRVAWSGPTSHGGDSPLKRHITQ